MPQCPCSCTASETHFLCLSTPPLERCQREAGDITQPPRRLQRNPEPSPGAEAWERERCLSGAGVGAGRLGRGTASLTCLWLVQEEVAQCRVLAPRAIQVQHAAAALTFSCVQAAVPGLPLPAVRDRSSRWRVPTTRQPSPPAISARVCGRGFPGRPAVTSPGARLGRLPPSPPLS